MINFERLITLAEHLQKPVGDRLHEEFNFGCVNSFLGDGKTIKGIPFCGSAGCAMGEAPLLWPELIQFQPDLPASFSLLGCDAYDEDRQISYTRAAQWLFNITLDDAVALFSPNEPRYWVEYKDSLGRRPTASEVADSILAFVAYHREKNNENV